MKLTKAQKKLLDKSMQFPIIVSDEGFNFSNGESARSDVIKRLIGGGLSKAIRGRPVRWFLSVVSGGSMNPYGKLTKEEFEKIQTAPKWDRERILSDLLKQKRVKKK